MKLVIPNEEHEAAFFRYQEEWMKDGGLMVPGSLKCSGLTYAGWLEKIRRSADRSLCPSQYVPSQLYFLMADSEILGAIDCRENLNDALMRIGGHIGYGVRPSARGQGVASRMLILALEIYRKKGVPRVLLTCDKDNRASARVIQGCDGKLEEEWTQENGNVVQRYWIETYCDLLLDFTLNFETDVLALVPLVGGWKNRKWRTTLADCPVVIKQLSSQRYSGDALGLLSKSIAMQNEMALEGLPCPRVWSFSEGPIRSLGNGMTYMVMEDLPGEHLSAEGITLQQIANLGAEVGRLHRLMNREGQASGEAVYKTNASSEPESLLGTLYSHTETLMSLKEDFETICDGHFMMAYHQNLNWAVPSFFERQPLGTGHFDLTPDNILFSGERVSGFLDFDRSHYGFIYHDLGRVILSFALMGDSLDMERVSAFSEGYRDYSPLEADWLERALRLTWIIETPWWLRPSHMKFAKPKLKRFLEELIWLTKYLAS